jgi:hypothetical protein
MNGKTEENNEEKEKFGFCVLCRCGNFEFIMLKHISKVSVRLFPFAQDNTKTAR